MYDSSLSLPIFFKANIKLYAEAKIHQNKPFISHINIV